MNFFTKLVLIQDLAAIAQATGALVTGNLDLIGQFEDVVLEAVALVRKLDLAGAQQFVADAKALWVAAAARYDGTHAAVEDLIAKFKKLVADAQG